MRVKKRLFDFLENYGKAATSEEMKLQPRRGKCSERESESER